MATPLPDPVALTDPSTTQAQAKTWFTNLRAYLAGLLGTDGGANTALSALGILNSIFLGNDGSIGTVRANLGISSAFYNNRGTWSAASTYAKNDLVVDPFNSLAYVCILAVGPVATQPHADPVHWQLPTYVAPAVELSQSFLGSGAPWTLTGPVNQITKIFVGGMLYRLNNFTIVGTTVTPLFSMAGKAGALIDIFYV